MEKGGQRSALIKCSPQVRGSIAAMKFPRYVRLRDFAVKTFKAFAWLCASVAFALLVTEVLLRLLYPVSRSVRYVLKSDQDLITFEHLGSIDDMSQFLPTMFAPHSYHVGSLLDEHGLNTEPYEIKKKPNTFRIVTIGDSFAFSSGGVPRNLLWHTRVADFLHAKLGVPVEDINLGLPGAGPRLEKRMFEVEGARLSPDLVLVEFFVGNDLTDEYDVRSRLKRASYVARLIDAGIKLPQLLRTVWFGRKDWTPGYAVWAPGAYSYDRTSLSFPLDRFLTIEKNRAALFLDSKKEWMDTRIGEVADVLARLQQSIAAHGAKTVFIVIPDELQVNDVLNKKISALLGTGTVLHTESVQADVMKAFAARGIPAIDLLPDLKAFALVHSSPYRPQDTHWDDRGNAIAAEAISRYIEGADWFEHLR